VAAFVKYELDDGSVILFETDKSDLVSSYSGDDDAISRGRLDERFRGIAQTAQQLLRSTRAVMTDVDEVTLTFGVKVSADAGFVFAKAKFEGAIDVTLTWKQRTPPVEP
jgi:hypothetical protein